MKLQQIEITPKEFAEKLRAARISKSTLNPPSTLGAISLNWAQEVQREELLLRIKDGEQIIGAKLGLTSPAKQKAMKIDQPVFGFITDAMMINGVITLEKFNQPRIEPELVIKTSKEISSIITLEQAPLYIDSLTAGIEIIDSRYHNFEFTFEDVIADNTSATAFSFGELKRFEGQDISKFTGYIEEDGVLKGEGLLSELLGNPLNTLVALSEYLLSIEVVLPAGSLLLAGSMTNAIPLLSGHRYRAGIRELAFSQVEVKINSD